MNPQASFSANLARVALACVSVLFFGPATAARGERPQNEMSAPQRAAIVALNSAPASDAEAARFLTMATFGPTPADIASLRALGYAEWIRRQLALPPTLQRPAVEKLDAYVTNPGQIDRLEISFRTMVTAPDQLRQRLAWTMSQILVVSDRAGNLDQDPVAIAEYADTLARDVATYADAAGVSHPASYYNLIYDVTRSPAMGKMLSYTSNRKGDPLLGTSPDENYGRELMQLFSVGLILRNADFSPKLDANGAEIPTYTEATVAANARVFTGWSYQSGFGTDPSSGNWAPANYQPLVCYAAYHDSGAKTLISPSGNYGATSDAPTLPAGTSCENDLAAALKAITSHPNVAPFISRQLIQRLTTSNPTPAYIARVSAVFSATGGDLGQVAQAILLDTEALTGTIPTQYPGYTFGKLREPLLRLTALWRYYAPATQTGKYMASHPENYYTEHPYGANSVFNFYQPDYRPPGELAASGQYAPELQVLTESTIMTIANDLTARAQTYVGNPSNAANALLIDISPLTAIAGNAANLVDQVNHDLLYGSMSSVARNALIGMLNDKTSYSFLSAQIRVRDLLKVVLVSPEFAVQK